MESTVCLLLRPTILPHLVFPRNDKLSLVVPLGAMGNRSLKSQLRQANNLGVGYTVIIGEEELKTGTVTLRDMSTAEQKNVPLDQVPNLMH